MKRTTVYLDTELELRLKAEARRLGQPMAELIRDALRQRVEQAPPSRSRHAGAFTSGSTDTADRVDELLRETGFGEVE
ncbi:MAG: CopG family transcriptional regulator [Sporichthyaceae bacterium]